MRKKIYKFFVLILLVIAASVLSFITRTKTHKGDKESKGLGLIPPASADAPGGGEGGEGNCGACGELCDVGEGGGEGGEGGGGGK